MGRSQSHFFTHSSSSSTLRFFSSLITTNTYRTFSRIFQQCSNGRALSPGKQAHSRMILSGFSPTIFVSNCLLQMYVKCWDLNYAKKVFDEMPQRDTVSWNTLIFGFAELGNMEIACAFFEAMPRRDVVSWNSMISGYLQNGKHFDSVDFCVRMRSSEVGFDATSLALFLKACSMSEDLELGAQIHSVAVRMGYDIDVVTGSSLLDMYAKCKRLECSFRVFETMPVRNWVSWSAVIAGCVQNGQFFEGLEIFVRMQRLGIGVSQSSYASVFKSCAWLLDYRFGAQLHGHSIKTHFGCDVLVGTAVLDMYAKCGKMFEARKQFEKMPNHSLQSYNAIIIGCVRSLLGNEALYLFLLLRNSGLGFDEVSLSGALGASAVIKAYYPGVQLHGLAVKSQLRSNTCVANAILDMYGKCGYLTEASILFDEMVGRDAVSWNAIIAANEQNDNGFGTLRNFVSMLHSRLEPDQFTYGSVLKVCAAKKALNHGMEIHGRIIKSGLGLDSFVGGALVDLYSKCAVVEEAEKIHNRTEEKTMVSWNAIISGFSLQKQDEDGQQFFSRMLETSVEPDNFTYAAVLDTCANLATLGLGMQIHAQVIKKQMDSDAYVSNTLVDMYSKCGNMKESRLMFKKSRNRDPVTWNAMICGYVNHGLGEEAIKLFEEMILDNIKPNQATFISVLRACAYIGDVAKGLHYFDSMQRDYNLVPQLEHYSCMVDIIGRSGQLNEALWFIQEMPLKADTIVWRTMLNICKLHGAVDLAEMAARNLLELEPQDSSGYVLLSNIYADSGMWDEMSHTRRAMRSQRLKKEPGCSWIEVKDEVHAFLVGDKTHPNCQEIYERLHCLFGEMKWFGYSPYDHFEEEIEDEELSALTANT